MGNLIVNGSVPTSLGAIDRLYAGDELLWPNTPALRGWVLFSDPSLITAWVPPAGVTHVDVACIGRGGNGRVLNAGGGGGGGGLAWANDIPLDGITAINIVTPPATGAGGNPAQAIFNSGATPITTVRANNGANNINNAAAAGGTFAVTGRFGSSGGWNGGPGDIGSGGINGGGGGTAGWNGVGSSPGSGGRQGRPASAAGQNSGNGGGQSPWGFLYNSEVLAPSTAENGAAGASGADNGQPLGNSISFSGGANVNFGADFGGGTGTSVSGYNSSNPGRGCVLIRWGYTEKFPAWGDPELIAMNYPALPFDGSAAAGMQYVWGRAILAQLPAQNFNIGQTYGGFLRADMAQPASWLTGLDGVPTDYQLGVSTNGALPATWASISGFEAASVNFNPGVPGNCVLFVRRASNSDIVKQITYGTGITGPAVYTPPPEGPQPNRMGSLIFLDSVNSIQTKGVFHNPINQTIGQIVSPASFEFRVNFVSGGFEGGSSSPLNAWLSVPASYNSRNNASHYVTLKVEVRRMTDQVIVSTWWIRLNTDGANTNSFISYSAIP